MVNASAAVNDRSIRQVLSLRSRSIDYFLALSLSLVISSVQVGVGLLQRFDVGSPIA
jgi:hypothetical protein